MFLYLKAAHVVFVVTWFAGLFYIVRLFVYLAEVSERSESEREILEPQLRLMARRLWLGITWPSAVVTLLLGMGLLHTYLESMPTWLVIKLALVGLLFAYHLVCHQLYLRFARGERPATPMQLRIWNEGATLFLVAIVFLVVLKGQLDLVRGSVMLAVMAALLATAIVFYRRLRARRLDSSAEPGAGEDAGDR